MTDHSRSSGLDVAGVAAEAMRSPERIGRRRFLKGVGASAGLGALAGTLPSGLASAAVLPAGASRFRALPKAVRVADMRSPANYDFLQIAPNWIRVGITGVQSGAVVIPETATAAVLTVTAVNNSETNYVSCFPTGTPIPNVSNLNLEPVDVATNMVTVKIGSGGQVDVFSYVPCSLIVDVLGFYEPVDQAVQEGRFVGLETAKRPLDTRPALVGPGSFTEVDVTSLIPDSASSVVINLTATETTGGGFFTAVPFTVSTEPTTSSLNVRGPGETRAAGVIVPVSTISGKRRIKIYTQTPAKLIVDVVGYFTGPTSPFGTSGLFVAIDPERVLDTRHLPIGKLWPGWVVEGPVPVLRDQFGDPVNTSAVVGNLTLVDSRGWCYLTMSSARRPIPPTSNVNATYAGAIAPNHAITPITATYGFQVFSSAGSHVLFDLAGYYLGIPSLAQLAEYPNPAPPAAPTPWVLRVPRLGLTSTVEDGDAVEVTDRGRSWHWTGTGLMGQQANVSLFAHRTEAGAPYRNLHTMVPGDLFTVTTNDNREYTYRVLPFDSGNITLGGNPSAPGRALTDAQNLNILAATRMHPGTTLSLIACTVGNDSSKSGWPDRWAPTSLEYRIVVTGELISWREI